MNSVDVCVHELCIIIAVHMKARPRMSPYDPIPMSLFIWTIFCAFTCLPPFCVQIGAKRHEALQIFKLLISHLCEVQTYRI